MTAAAEIDRIWFNPSKFWAATKHLPPEQVDQFMQELLLLAERRDVPALRKFDFIRVEGPQEGRAA